MDLQNNNQSNDTLILDDIPRSSLMNIGPVKEASQEDEQSERLDNSRLDTDQPRFSTESLIGILKEPAPHDQSYLGDFDDEEMQDSHQKNESLR
jgi:hypothetical protein